MAVTRSRHLAAALGGAAAAVALMITGCAGADDPTPASAPPMTAKSAPTATTVPSATAPKVTPPTNAQGVVDTGALLAPLAIDDRPLPGYRYDRADWPHWDDTDGDGCDGRNQALAAGSITPPQITYPGCQVVAGDWFSDYDGFTTSDPSELDVDHLVSLAEAHQAGGWRWSTARKRLFANDQSNLWVVSAGSNRSKGSLGPDQWRPPRPEVWCDYAIRWVSVKVAWGLTATTDERDALGAMVDRCARLPGPAD